MRAAKGWVLCALALLAGCGSDSEDPPAAPSTYSVGGNVSGLNGSVVLANNGGDARTLNANGAFTFVTALATGAAYSVAITSQPANQTCTVVGGAGTVGTANISSIAVSCVTNTATVGGTITGLRSAITLQNNGGDNLSHTSDGAFAFSQGVAFGSTYSVTISSQPSAPAQVCTVTNGAGTVAGTISSVVITCTLAPSFTQQPLSQSVVAPAIATFTAAATGIPTPTIQWQMSTNAGANWTDIAGATSNSFTTPATTLADNDKRFRAVATNSAGSATSLGPILTVSAPPSGKTWRAPVLISEVNGAYDSVASQIAMNARGDAIVAWQRLDSNGTTIWANVYLVGSGWLGATLVGGDAGFLATNPQVDIDFNGNAVVVWEAREGPVGRTDIRSAYYTVAGGWGGSTLVETDDGVFPSVVSTYLPRVTMSDSGVALVVWSQWDTFTNDSRSVVYATGAAGNWSPTSVIATNNASLPVLAGNAAGIAAVAWGQFDGAQFHIKASRYDGSGWSVPALIDTDTSSSSAYPGIGISANGDIVAVWKSLGEAKLMGARAVNGVWSAERRFSEIGTTVTGATEPGVVFDAAGNAIVHWYGENFGSGGDYYATLNNGAWSNSMQRLSSSGGGGLRIAMNASGQALSTFVTQSNVRANTDYNIASGVSTVLSAGAGYYAKIAIDDDGEAIAIWVQSDGNANRIWASEFRE